MMHHEERLCVYVDERVDDNIMTVHYNEYNISLCYGKVKI